MVRIQTGQTERIQTTALDAALAPLTGLTDLVVALVRVSDNFSLDWSDMTFKAAGWTTRQAPLTELSAINYPGEYYRDLDTSAITNAAADDSYHVHVTQTPGTSVANVPQAGEIKVGQWPDKLDAAVSSRSSHTPAQVDTQLAGSHGAGSWQTATPPTAAAIAAEVETVQATAHGAGSWETGAAPSAADVADAVWDEEIAGHLGGDKAGQRLMDAAATADPGAIADAVWDELKADHTISGSYGEIVGPPARFIQLDTSLATHQLEVEITRPVSIDVEIDCRS